MTSPESRAPDSSAADSAPNKAALNSSATDSSVRKRPAGNSAPVNPSALNSPALSGIRRLSAVGTVRARISLAVDLGLLAPGEWLPANDRIAAALEVSEITVRRALVSLCSDGVLERRRGRHGGTRVAEHPVRGSVRETDAYRAASEDVHRLIDERLILECGIAHVAATDAGDAVPDRLDELVERMDRADDWAEFHSDDERFHLAVAEATGIDAVTEQYRPALHELYRYYLPYPTGHLHESNAEHRALTAAIRRRDPVAAVDIARRHVHTLHRTMFVAFNSEQPQRPS